MATINERFRDLPASYLFSEIRRKTEQFKETNPDVEIFKLGIGDTTEALDPRGAIANGLLKGAQNLAYQDSYTGYGDELGDVRLRDALGSHYAHQGIDLKRSEVFISDGAKCDAAHISDIFSPDSKIAVQDPVYPVYVDSNVIRGKGGKFVNGHYEDFVYLPCTAENGFVPDLPDQPVDLIYICSPNNPTGAVASREKLRQFVDYAQEQKAVIIFDAAYAPYIVDESLPKSIYEVEGAKQCAIEINSFSKWIGFTGVRLGWTVVPEELVVDGTVPGELNKAWARRQTTMFNGASNIAQRGGAAVFTEAGQHEAQTLVDYYMGNARLIRRGLSQLGLTVYGGVNAPYIWMKTPDGLNSWDCFDKLLNEAHVVGTPGSGFGPCGEGYIRFSAFGHRENIAAAVRSIQDNFKLI